MRHDDAAERAVRCGDLLHDCPERRLVPEHVDAAEVHRLELDPPRPGGSQLPEDAEGDRVLGRKGVEVGADRARAVGEGGAKRELHPAAHVRGGPAGGAVGGDRQPGGVGGPVWIGGAGPDLALVEMGVQVDEGGKDHRAPHVHALARRPGDDPSSLDGEVEGREAPRSANEAGGRSQVREREPRHVGEAHEVRRMAHLVKLPFRLQPRTSLCTEVQIRQAPQPRPRVPPRSPFGLRQVAGKRLIVARLGRNSGSLVDIERVRFSRNERNGGGCESTSASSKLPETRDTIVSETSVSTGESAPHLPLGVSPRP